MVNFAEYNSRFQQARKYFEILEKKYDFPSTNKRTHGVLKSICRTSRSLGFTNRASVIQQRNGENWESTPAFW